MTRYGTIPPGKCKKKNALGGLRNIFFHREASPRSRGKPATIPEHPVAEVEHTQQQQPDKPLRVRDYAWSFHGILASCASRKRLSSGFLYFQLAALTFATILASVLYGHLYDGFPGYDPLNPTQIVVFALTILLPIYVTFLTNQETDKNQNPTARWNALQVAGAKLESEIFQFRAQVGPYRKHANDETDQWEMVKASDVFAARTREIFESVKPYLEDCGVKLDNDYWEEKMDLGDSTFVPRGDVKTKESPPPSPSRPSPSNENIAELPQLGYEYDTTYLKTERTRLLREKRKAKEEADKPETKDIEKNEPDPEKPKQDDGYSAISAQEYMDFRVKKAITSKTSDVKGLSSWNAAFNRVIKLLIASTSLMSALSLQWIVPIVLGVAAALGSSQGSLRYDRRIHAGTIMTTNLAELEQWWQALSDYAKEQSANKERLVESSEKVIVGEVMLAASQS